MNERPLRIAVMVGKFPAMSETFILNQITGLIDGGHEVDIFARNHPTEARFQPEVDSYHLLERTRYLSVPPSHVERVWRGMGILARMVKAGRPEIIEALNIRSYGPRVGSLRRLYLLYPLLENGPYDILHCHFGPIGLAGVQLKEMGISGKLIVAFHGNDLSSYLRRRGPEVYQRLFQAADLLLPVSDYWRRRLVELGADPARILVHRMGIDLKRFAYYPRRLPENSPVRLLTVARLVEKKGIHIAIRALATVLQRHPRWKIRYDVIGSGEQEPELRALIEALNLQGVVRLLGARNSAEVARHLRHASIFVLPSITGQNGDQEGIPVSLMEAMACGLPVLSTLHSGIPELVQDGITGYLAPEGDPQALAGRLERLVEQPERWEEMGQAGRQQVERHHNLATLTRDLVGIYRALLAGGEETNTDEQDQKKI